MVICSPSGKPGLAAVLDDAVVLPQRSDGFTLPSLARRLKGRLGYLKVLDARHMVEDVVAELVPAIEPEGEMNAKSSLRLIPSRVWQGAFVLEHLSKIAAINPAAARRTADEVFGIILRRITLTLCKILAAGNVGHLLQSSSASRLTAAQAGFFILSQCGERPDLYGKSSRLDTMPSRPILQAWAKDGLAIVMLQVRAKWAKTSTWNIR